MSGTAGAYPNVRVTRVYFARASPLGCVSCTHGRATFGFQQRAYRLDARRSKNPRIPHKHGPFDVLARDPASSFPIFLSVNSFNSTVLYLPLDRPVSWPFRVRTRTRRTPERGLRPKMVSSRQFPELSCTGRGAGSQHRRANETDTK